MKKFMKKCKKALVIAMTIILVGTSIDTSTLYVRAENAADVTEESGDQQGQLSEVEGIGEQQTQLDESDGSDEQQTQTDVLESGEELKNQPGETEVDYEDLSRLEEGSDEQQGQSDEEADSDESQNQTDEDADNGDVQNQPAEIDFSFLEDLIIDLPEPETSIPPMGFFSLRNGVVTLASGNHAEWIDRIDLSDDTSNSLRTLYNQMEEWTDNDGVEDWLITGEKDLYTVGSIDIELDLQDQQAAQQAVNTALTNYAQYVWAITYAFDRDHPEVFWLGAGSVSGGAYSNGTAGSYTLEVYLQLKTDTRDIRAERYRDVTTLKAAIATMNTNANAILAGAEGLDTVGKIKYFNEKLTKSNEYNTIVSSDLDDSNVNRDSWECVSALAGQTGEVGPVCEAYARAFKVLCDRSGIPCILEDGDAGGPHMWNAVQVEGNWYATDVTWNDPTGGNSGAISGNENERWLLVGTETVINGNAFAVSHITQNSPAGTLQFLNGPVLSSEKYTSTVASVTTTGGVTTTYDNLDDAIVAAFMNEGSTMKLLKSLRLSESCYFLGTFNFDLNGYTLSVGDDYSVYVSEGKLTICDNSADKTGKITGSSTTIVSIYENAELVLASGIIEQIEGDYAIFNDGSFTMKGGTVKAEGTSENAAITALQNYGETSLSGGTIECNGVFEADMAVCNAGTFTITGNTARVTCAAGQAIYNGAVLSISGTPTIIGGSERAAINHLEGNFTLSGAPTITGGVYGDIVLVPGYSITLGALSNTTPYKVSLLYLAKQQTGVFAGGNVSNAATKFEAVAEGMEVVLDGTSLKLDYEKGDISIRITWEDEDDKYGLRPETVTVSVYANGVFSKEVELTAEDDWEYTIEDAYSYDADGSITYSVEFYDATGKYEGTDGPAEDGFNIIASLNEISSEEYVQLIPYNGDYDPFKPDGVDAVKVNLLHPDLENTATIQYSTDGGNTWSTTVPKIKNVGSMSVMVKVTSPIFSDYKATLPVVMYPYNISSCIAELEKTDYYYTGKEIKPTAIGLIDDLGQQLPINAADIVESYENNIAVGAATVSVSVNSSNYTGTAKIDFHIEYYNGDITILYNGSEDHETWFAEDVVITAEGYSVKFAEDDTFADSVIVSGEGEIEVELIFKQDGTGYITDAWSGSVLMDKTGPIFTEEGDGLTLVIPSESSDKEITWNQLATEITYDIYANAYTYALIYASDKYSSVDGLYYYLDTTGSEAALTKAQLDALREAGKFEQIPDGVFDLSLEQDGKYVIYAYATDDLGNVSEYISSNGIVIDSIAPVVEVVEPTEEAGTLKDTEMTFKVKADEDVMIGVYLTTDYSGESQNMKISNDEYGYWESYPAGEQTEAHEDGKTYISYKVFADANETKTITITGLKPNTYYEYSVEVYDLAQNGTVVAGEEDEMEPGMYWLKEITTLKTVPTFAENPTITGTYGDKLSEMTVSQPVSTNGVAGTWSIVYAGAGQRNDMPAVGGTTAYDVMFTPEDADTYETVTVKVVPDVAKMPLTVKIDNQTRVYGEENSELTYTITEGSIVDSNYAGRPRLNIELSTEATKTSDAGTYEIIATVINDDNYAVTVQEGTLTITQADAIITVEAGKDKYNKTFGDDDFNLSGISTNSDGNISYGVIGESVSVSSIGKVVIRGAGSSTITVHVPATKNYKASETVEITITVAKADIDAVNVSKNYLYLNDAQDTIDLSTYVPADAGNVTYSVGAASGECEFVVAPTVDANGKLSYTVKAGAVGESAFFMATVNSDNYKSLVIKVNVALVDKTPVAEKSGSEVSLKNNTLTYGEALSKLEFNEAVFVAEGSGEVVSGTLAWENPANEPAVATTKATWVFTPDDDQYMSVTGELTIVVKKAVQPAFSIDDLGKIEYFPGGSEKTPVTTVGGVEDGEVTITVPANNNVIALDEDGWFTMLNAGTVTITAVCVDPYGNYEDATATYELTILPYELKAHQIIWEDGVTGAETYDGTAKEPAIWMYMITGSLTEGTEYTVTYVNNIDVYTLTEADAGFDASKAPAVVVTGKGNYTGTVKKYFVINKANASIAVENDTYTKTYGDESFVLSGITKVGDGTLVYTVKDSKNAAGQAVAQDKVLTVDATGKVTIVGAGSAVITVGMAETENYKAAEEVSITVNVAKASYTTEAIERGYAYNKDNADTVDLTEKLPADIQDASFAVSEKEGDASFVVAPAIDTTGKLTYTLKKGAKGQSATLEVLVTSANYKDFYITVELELAYEVLVVLKEGSEVAVVGELTYGDALSKLPFAEAVFVEEGTDIVVEGTLSWETPDAVLEVETTKATWVFTPDNANYSTVKGTVTIKINKAEQPEFSIVPVTDASYGMEGSIWLETTGGVEGAEITFTVPKDNGVVTDVNKNGLGKFFIVPINSGKVIITAVAVDPEGNYEDAVATYELTVAPASIKADWISWLDGFTGVGTYNGNEITPGVKVYFIAEGNLTEGEDYTVSYVNNTYAYTLKEGDEGFDATKAPAVVVTGKGNYTGSAKVYFVINKAEAAPNMPKSTKSVASHVATAGQVSLPTDWIWQEPNTALTEGGETIAVAVYNGADKGNYVKETVSVTITRMEAGAPYVSEINGEDVEDIENGWQHVSDDLDAAAEGDVITVEMNGVTVLPGSVIDNIKGKNITVELDMGNGVIWTINGKNITATTVEDVDLKVDLNTTNIPVEVINKITGEISTMQISLAHDGDFGYKAFMRINLDAANAGYYAQLFHYEEASKVLKYMNQSKIDAAGYVELPFTHASEYTIVIDDVAYQVPGSGGSGGGSSAPAATPTPAPTQAPPATKLPNTADEFPLEGILLLMMVCMAAFGGTVAYGKCKKAGRK